jgi:hypothetical protein
VRVLGVVNLEEVEDLAGDIALRTGVMDLLIRSMYDLR